MGSRRMSDQPLVLTTLGLWAGRGGWRRKPHAPGSQLLIVAPARQRAARRCLLAVARAAAAKGRRVTVISS